MDPELQSSFQDPDSSSYLRRVDDSSEEMVQFSTSNRIIPLELDHEENETVSQEDEQTEQVARDRFTRYKDRSDSLVPLKERYAFSVHSDTDSSAIHSLFSQFYANFVRAEYQMALKEEEAYYQQERLEDCREKLKESFRKFILSLKEKEIGY